MDILEQMESELDQDCERIMFKLIAEANFVGVTIPEYLELRHKIIKEKDDKHAKQER